MQKINSNIEKNKENILQLFSNSPDIITKSFSCANTACLIVYLRGLVDIKSITDFVIKPCIYCKSLPKQNVLEEVKNNIILFPEIETVDTFEKIREELPKGKCFLFLEKQNEALMLAVDMYKERSLAEPPTNAVLNGPREGFVENIKTNLSVVRKILSTAHLKANSIIVGDLTKTQVSVVYLDNVAKRSVVSDIVATIKNIHIDGIIDSFYISSFLEKRKQSMFKQVGYSEKPDVIAAKLLEGRVAIFVDGSPIVLTLPFVLLEDLQNSDDYYNQHSRATFLRILRAISFFITVMLPGLYISIQLYHYKAIPLSFLVTIMNSTQGLPFTPLTEILFVLVLFEILYEASLRMPRYLGLALSIVGALILGDTAVKAGLISPPAVMIVALSGITLYVIPEESAQFSLLRLFYTLAGGLLGIYGIVLISIFLVLYLNDFDSYGSPYLAPLSPNVKNDMKDAFKKSDIVDLKTRPKSIPNVNKTRMKK